MQKIASLYDTVTKRLSGAVFESIALLFTRVALAGVFWRSGRTKVEEGSFLELSDTTYFLFEHEYSGVPLSHEIAAPMATYAEHAFPILLVLGLATRFSALSLLLMTMVIQFFVYPEAWWATHILWVAMAAILVSRGGGLFSLDAIVGKMRAK